mgnify:CR=1 FL=1
MINILSLNNKINLLKNLFGFFLITFKLFRRFFDHALYQVQRVEKPRHAPNHGQGSHPGDGIKDQRIGH